MAIRMDGWQALKDFYNSWGAHFRGHYDKVIAYAIIVFYLFLSIASTMLYWENCDDLTLEDYEYGLVTGPPKAVSLRGLKVFTVSSSICCVVECINTITLMCNGGHVRLPVEIEQALVLLLSDIPLAVTNLSIVMCRSNVATRLQMLVGLAGLLRCSLRMYLYGCLKERLFKYERSGYKWTLKIAWYITASVILLIHILTLGFTWDHAKVAEVGYQGREAKLDALRGVSVVLAVPGMLPFSKYGIVDRVQLPNNSDPNTTLLTTMNIANFTLVDDLVSDLIEEQARDVVDDQVSDIKRSGDFDAKFYCIDSINATQPSVCSSTRGIKFRFRYISPEASSDQEPFGEIQYGLATVGNATAARSCRALDGPLDNQWDLHYLLIERSIPANETQEVTAVASPWSVCCMAPRLRHNALLNPCIDR